MRTRSALALGLLAVGGCTAGTTARGADAARPARDERGALRALVDSLTGAPEFRNAHWGVLIVDPARGDTLYSRNAGKLFMPASNQKIVTGAVALAQLGPDYRFRTLFARRGTMRGDTLVGDLLVIGRGDPSISDHMRGDAMRPLRDAADSLRARGVRVVAGRVLAAGDAFPDAPLGFGWAWDDLDAPYAAGVDELLFNEGFSRVRIQAGRMPGDPVSTSVLPANGYPRLAIGAWTGDTLAAAGGRSLTIAADGDRPGFAVLTGTIRPADTTTLEVAHRNPSAAFLAAFEQALRERGILVVTAGPGGIGRPATSTVSTVSTVSAASASSAAAPPGTVAPAPPTDTLFALLSPPLREIMPALEKPSQNQIAEALYKTLGLERLGVGTADSGRVVVERQLRAWGIDTTGFVIRDGSGLSRHDYLSPETVVRVLDVVRQAPYFRVFYDALPIAGVDGTIANRMRGTAAQANVRAKTGYIDRARSLSGYVTTADGHLLVFSFLANNWTVPVKGVERVQDTVAAQLARMRLGGPAGPAIGGR